jgi:hypothetical protein
MNTFFLLLCVQCVMLGPSLVLAGVILYASMPCDTLEIFDITSMRESTFGIGLCDAYFTYHDGSLNGTLPMTPCPRQSKSARHPQNYQVSLLASSLDVDTYNNRDAAIMAFIGASLMALPMLVWMTCMPALGFDQIKQSAKTVDIELVETMPIRI